jgi:hypothetical protein
MGGKPTQGLKQSISSADKTFFMKNGNFLQKIYIEEKIEQLRVYKYGIIFFG